ncbi:MAG TPA: DUF1800 domain-containing protein [Pyrinomonadaceae bacterium]|nr:DUF1800 domain-containing protein [Pyrinomonadaceae bacterium]
MKDHRYFSVYALHARWLSACVVLSFLCLVASAQVAPGSPVLLTEGTGTTTRGVAYDAITFRAEPFTSVSPYNWNADKTNTRDQQTRLMMFAMNLNLLAGEGANALTADAQDAAGKVYPLKVESLTNPLVGGAPQGWLYAVVLRLDDSMTDALGDVLVRISLHGLSSNRVRIAIGQTGGGPSTDAANEIIAAAPATPPLPTPTPTPKAYGPGDASVADIHRLLEQATWGPKGDGSDVSHVQQIGIRAFLDEQFAAPVANPSKGSDWPDLTFPADDINDANFGCPSTKPSDPNYNQAACTRDNYSVYPLQKQFFSNALAGQTQLRQRVAFALHQILVVSALDENRPSWMTPYLQALDRNAFGSYRTLLGDVTLTPAMGDYLNMNQSTASSPNENFAREVNQLFSVGVNQLNVDGSPVLDSQGNPVPTYTQTDVSAFTRVFTGWRFATAFQNGVTNYRDPMTPRGSTNHDTGSKNLYGTVLAGCPGANNNTNPTNAQCAQTELNAALDVIFNHPNVGPFVSRQLIQHLVTSNPSPAYVQRVASVFNNDCNGLYPESPCGTRGNLKAVVRNILLDPEARGDVKTDPNYGKLREPAQYINNILRAFNATSDGVLGSQSRGGDLPGQLDQPVFQPTTVFSYYMPDYQVPGTKVLGPQFQILSTLTTLRRANVANTLIYSGIGTGANNPTGTQLNIASLDALAAGDGTGGQLVDQLNALLLHGTMSAQMRSAIMTALQSIPTSNPHGRAQTAVYLVVTSSQYDVQR